MHAYDNEAEKKREKAVYIEVLFGGIMYFSNGSPCCINFF